MDYRLSITEKTDSELSTFNFQLSTSQRGFVSIFSVLIIMTILALITLGFSSVMRNAQRRTIDSQLNTQAFYSAESAVNDAKAYLKYFPGSSITSCQSGDPAYFSFNNTLDPGRNVGYTCLLLDSQPPDLVFSSVAVQGLGNATVVPFESSSGLSIASFNIRWDSTSGGATVPSPANPANYPNIIDTTGGWDTKLGILRVDIYPTLVSRTTMESDGFTFFLYPTQNGGSTNNTVRNSVADQGNLVMVKCVGTGKGPCNTDIFLNNVVVGGSLYGKYTMRLQAIYNPVSVTISNVKDISTANVDLLNGQAVVDATGKANDVFRRIQVRLPLTQRGYMPAFAIQSADSICKRMLGSPTGSTVDSAFVIDPGGASACALNN